MSRAEAIERAARALGFDDGYRAGVNAAANLVAQHHIERWNHEVIRLDSLVVAIRDLLRPSTVPMDEGDLCRARAALAARDGEGM